MKKFPLRKHPCVPNPKALVANHGWKNYSIHSPYSCHQEPGGTGAVCKPTPHQPLAERFNQTHDVESLQLWFSIFTFTHLVCWFVFLPLSSSRFVPNSCLTLQIFSPHFISYHFISHPHHSLSALFYFSLPSL